MIAHAKGVQAQALRSTRPSYSTGHRTTRSPPTLRDRAPSLVRRLKFLCLSPNNNNQSYSVGTAVYIYGVDAPNSGTFTFTVDDDNHTTETHVYDGASVIYGATLYSATGLSNELHTLNFEMTKAPEDGGVGCVDYAVVTHEAIASVSS